MKRYIDAELLKKEIERRKDEYKKDRYMSDYRGQIAYYKDEIYDDLLSFIDFLQQEQPCETCTNDNGCVTCKDGELWEGKPVEDLEKEIDKTVNECTDGYNFDWDRFARHFYILGLKNNIPVTQITLDELAKDGEPVSEDLEAAAKEIATDILGKDYLSELDEDCAIDALNEATNLVKAGAEWQKKQMGEQARKELAKTDITLADLVAFDEGCKIGRRLERQDILRDAVERAVKIDSGGYPYINITAELYDYEHDVPLAKEGELVKIVIVKEDKE